MGAMGRTPKPAAIRRNASNPASTTQVLPRGTAQAPEPDEDWHPIAFDLYISLTESPQAELYASSDWMFAFLFCENVSRHLKPVCIGWEDRWNRDSGQMEHLPRFERAPLKGGDLQAILKMGGNLLITEVDRRRAFIELQDAAAGGTTAAAKALEEARAALQLVPPLAN